ncbi:MAG: hypothetical protein LBR18_05430, partial [Tannerella sp.]|nr:hypothetical protein [Tannerella sp.]
MKKIVILLLAVAIFASCNKTLKQTDSQILSEMQFVEPDSTYHSGVWWWWLRCYTSKEALTLDLEEMKAKKLQRLILSDFGQAGLSEELPYLDMASPEWYELVRHSIRECKRLGLDFGFCIGATGPMAPWVTPDEGLKKLVYADTVVDGGASLRFKLPEPKDVRKDDGGKPLYYKDIALYAIPAATETVPIEKIVNITAKMDAEGVLTWDNAPAGRWKILRAGYEPTYHHMNNLFSQDVLRTDVYDSYYARYFGEALRPLTPEERSVVKILEEDSYENGSGEWNEYFAAEFKKRRGYDPLPYLPALSDQVIESKEVSERFKYDLKLTVSDLFAEHYRYVQQKAHNDGMQSMFEASGPHQHFADALLLQKYSDMPMGEFWIPARTHRTTLETQIMTKEAVSAAHIYGKTVIPAESFTCAGPQWEESPWSLKCTADRAFCEGINRIYFHAYSQSPSLTAKPGYVYYPGSHFDRNITWWDYAYDWLAYLSRCQYMLQQGIPVADVSFWYGDGYQRKRYRQEVPRVGRGRLYDYTNNDAILTRMSVRDGKIVLPDGMTYSVLVMPDVQEVALDGFGNRMNNDNVEELQNSVPVEVMKKLRELVKGGATIVGSKPLKSVGLLDYQANDRTVTRIADEMWGAS